MLAKEDVALSGNVNDKNHHYELEPSDCSDKTLIWTSDDPEIAKIENSYHVIGVSSGDTVIHAKTLDGKVTASIQVHVHEYKYSNTANGLAYFKCDLCNDTYTRKVPTSNNITWKHSGLTNYSSRVPKAIRWGESLEFYIQNKYTAEADQSVDDYILEIYDKGNLLTTRTITTSTKSFKMNTLGEKSFVLYPKYNPELKKSITFDVVNPFSGITVSSDVKETNTGQPVLFTAEKENGSDDCSYVFFTEDENGEQTVLRRYSNDNTFKWTPDKSGEFKIGVTVYDNKLMNYDAETKTWSNEEMTSSLISVSVKESEIRLKEGSVICGNPALTYGEKVGSLAFASPIFIDANSGKEVKGSIVWDEPNAVPDVGKYQAKWTFTPTDNNYNAVHGTVTVTVNKAAVTLQELPSFEAQTYNPERTLKDIVIQNPSSNVGGTWEWADQTIVPTCSNKQYEAVFTPESSNYQVVTKELSVEISPAEPYVSSVSADNVTYGKALSSAAIQGSAQYSKDKSLTVEGTFSWDNPDTVVKTSGEYPYTFSPKDSVNYKKVQGKVNITVNKLQCPDNMPAGIICVPNDVTKINQDILKDYEGWNFKASELGKALEIDKPIDCMIVYEGEDAEAYETTEGTVTVYRNQCLHQNTVIINKEDVSCTKDGYTGDTKCEDCQTVIKKGNVIRSEGHVVEDLPEVAPTCTKTGLSKGQKCKVCGEILKEQEILPKTAHEYNEETVAPTCTEKGYVKHTCIRCNDTYKDQYKDALGHTEVIDPAVEATTTSTGLTEGSHCSVCNKVLKKQEVIPKITTEPSDPVPHTDEEDNKEDSSSSNEEDQNREIKVSRVRITGNSVKIAAGKKIQLKVTVTPNDATNKAVKWISLNTKVATVNQRGLVYIRPKTGKKSVVIKAVATDGSGKYATWKILSMKGVVKKISISGKKTVKAGKSVKLKAKIKASKGANKKLQWISGNRKYATVSSSGKVKTMKAGKGKKVKITAMATDGSGKKKTVTIKIK